MTPSCELYLTTTARFACRLEIGTEQNYRQVAQLTQTERAAGWVSYGQK